MHRELCENLLQGWASSAWSLYENGLPGDRFPLGNAEAAGWKWEAVSIRELLERDSTGKYKDSDFADPLG